MANQNIWLVRGDTLAFGMEFDGLDQDLDSAYFTVKKNYDEENPLVQVKLGEVSEDGSIEKVETNKYRVRVDPSATASADPGQYVYDLQIGANGDVFTILNGYLNLEPDVTTVSEGE